jgi:hypothetical protein
MEKKIDSDVGLGIVCGLFKGILLQDDARGGGSLKKRMAW